MLLGTGFICRAESLKMWGLADISACEGEPAVQVDVAPRYLHGCLWITLCA